MLNPIPTSEPQRDLSSLTPEERQRYDELVELVAMPGRAILAVARLALLMNKLSDHYLDALSKLERLGIQVPQSPTDIEMFFSRAPDTTELARVLVRNGWIGLDDSALSGLKLR